MIEFADQYDNNQVSEIIKQNNLIIFVSLSVHFLKFNFFIIQKNIIHFVFLPSIVTKNRRYLL